MAKCLILEFQGVGVDEYNAVNKELGIDPKTGKGDWPDGIVSHAGGTTADGGLVVTEIWDSEDAQAAFMGSRLGAALGKVGVPEPTRVTWFDVVGQHNA